MQNRNQKSFNTTTSVSAISGQKDRSNEIKLWAILLLFVIFAIGGVCVYFKTIKAMEFSPIKLFEQTFIESPEMVDELSGDSKSSIGYDYWIKFKSLSDIHLRQATDFKPYLSEAGRISFAEHFADDVLLRQAPRNYIYLVRTEHTIGKTVNESLLINKHNHAYYYHICGI